MGQGGGALEDNERDGWRDGWRRPRKEWLWDPRHEEHQKAVVSGNVATE